METTCKYSFNFNILNQLVLKYVEKNKTPFKKWTSSLWHITGDHADLRGYRMLRKFARPPKNGDKRLEYEAWDRWKATDIRIAQCAKDGFPGIELYRLRQLRAEIAKILRPFRMQYDLGPLLGPGETFVSSGGDVSELSKLAHHRWTSTRRALPYFTLLLWSHRFTRRLTIRRFRKEKPVESILLECLFEGKPKTEGNLITYFGWMVRCLTDEVRGSRFATVPKDVTKDRPINIEPLGNIWFQKAIGNGIQRCLRITGNDLSKIQMIQRNRIADKSNATIDFSDASDSISWELIKWLFPSDLVKLLSKGRSTRIRYYDPESGKFHWWTCAKVSSMGNGFTFEVMTVLLLALARISGDRKATVCGDDVIINNNVAQHFIAMATSLGFVVNRTKTFVNSATTESCGAFHNRETGYMNSFDLTWAKNPAEARALYNKIWLYVNEYKDLRFKSLLEEMRSQIPEEEFGPIPWSHQSRMQNLASYYWCDSQESRVDKAADWIRRAIQNDTVVRVKAYQPEKVSIEEEIDRWAQAHLRLKVRSQPRREIRSSTAWYPVTIYCDQGGYLMNAQKYKSIRNKVTGYLRDVFNEEILQRAHWRAWDLVS